MAFEYVIGVNTHFGVSVRVTNTGFFGFNYKVELWLRRAELDDFPLIDDAEGFLAVGGVVDLILGGDNVIDNEYNAMPLWMKPLFVPGTYDICADLIVEGDLEDSVCHPQQLNISEFILDEMIPVGTVMAWLPNLPGVPALPDGWVECNGAVINDPESDLNGQVTPALNAGRFLRGAEASGGVGGAASVAHSHKTPLFGYNGVYTNPFGTSEDAERAAMWTSGSGSGPRTTYANTSSSSINTIPPYYEVVWIMKIK